jgi:hypothetical protein
MAIIAFSDTFQSTLLNYLENTHLNDTEARIGFYKGTVPTDFSGLTTVNSRSADQLVYTYTATNKWTVSGTSVILTTSFTAASASGVATWFFWHNADPGDGFPALVGTIGALGSGEDLELGNTTINSGAAYRVNQWALSLPVPYTY